MNSFKKKKSLLNIINIINDKSINKTLMTEAAEPIIMLIGMSENNIRK